MDQDKVRHKEILVVEDEESLNRALQKALEHAGYGVTGVYDGESALRILAENKYDLVLLDISLPKLNGFELLAEMSNRHDLTPVIALTNLSREESKNEALTLGAKDYIIKSDTSIKDIVKMVDNFN